MRSKKIIYWLPRILSILYIGFLGLFALDVFIPNQTIGYYVVAFFMHLIPNFILAVFLVIAWKNEKVGALLFFAAFLILMVMFWSRSFIWTQFILFSPLLIISLLFALHSKYLGGEHT